jgi:hypothetical protein
MGTTATINRMRVRGPLWWKQNRKLVGTHNPMQSQEPLPQAPSLNPIRISVHWDRHTLTPFRGTVPIHDTLVGLWGRPPGRRKFGASDNSVWRFFVHRRGARAKQVREWFCFCIVPQIVRDTTKRTVPIHWHGICGIGVLQKIKEFDQTCEPLVVTHGRERQCGSNPPPHTRVFHVVPVVKPEKQTVVPYIVVYTHGKPGVVRSTQTDQHCM